MALQQHRKLRDHEATVNWGFPLSGQAQPESFYDWNTTRREFRTGFIFRRQQQQLAIEFRSREELALRIKTFDLTYQLTNGAWITIAGTRNSNNSSLLRFGIPYLVGPLVDSPYEDFNGHDDFNFAAHMQGRPDCVRLCIDIGFQFGVERSQTCQLLFTWPIRELSNKNKKGGTGVKVREDAPSSSLLWRGVPLPKEDLAKRKEMLRTIESGGTKSVQESCDQPPTKKHQRELGIGYFDEDGIVTIIAPANAGDERILIPVSRFMQELHLRVEIRDGHLSRVAITGKADRNMVFKKSGAKVFMTDFEDVNSPTWRNQIEDLYDATRGQINYTNPVTKQEYLLKKDASVVRSRDWLPEKHVLIDEEKPISASLFDFDLYVYHNAKALQEKGSGPDVYVPKLENAQEAQLWADVFAYVEQRLGLAHGNTVLIERLLATYQMDDYVHPLQDYIVGINCGDWKYIFSYIKVFRNHRKFLLHHYCFLINMTSDFLSAYKLLSDKIAHQRKIFAMGRMAAQMPINARTKSARTRTMGALLTRSWSRWRLPSVVWCAPAQWWCRRANKPE